MFFKLCSPASTKLAATLPCTCRQASSEIARFGNAFNPCRDIDAVAEDIPAFDDDVADIDANPDLDRIGLGATSIVLPKLSLNLDGARDGIDGAREFHPARRRP